MYGLKQTKVNRFILQRTGTYNPQFRRPYTTSLDNQTHNMLVESLAGETRINPTSVANSINFINISAQPEEQVNIANGWEQERVRFLLEIQNTDYIGNTITEYIIGFTDIPGISAQGNLDPNMLFYINAINTTRTATHVTPVGTQVHHNLVDASHILLDPNHTGGFSTVDKKYSIRPEDLFNTMSATDLSEGMQEGDYILDTRSTLAKAPVRSRRDNNLGTQYTADILQAYFSNSVVSTGDINEIRSQAAAQCASLPTNKNSFMSFLRDNMINGNMGYNPNKQNNNFTLAELQSFDPTWSQDKIAVVPISNDYIRSSLHTKEQSKPWGGCDLNTVWASTIVQSLPAIMLQCLVNKIHLFVTNTGMGGTPVTSISNVKTFNNGIDNSDNLVAFINKLETQLMRSLSQNNEIPYTLEVICDLLGDTCISIQTQFGFGGDPDRYVCPSFSDSLMTPIVTSSQNNLNGITSDFDALITGIGDIRGNPTINHTPIMAPDTQSFSTEQDAYNLI